MRKSFKIDNSWSLITNKCVEVMYNLFVKPYRFHPLLHVGVAVLRSRILYYKSAAKFRKGTHEIPGEFAYKAESVKALQFKSDNIWKVVESVHNTLYYSEK